jgi:hypothetical protein
MSLVLLGILNSQASGAGNPQAYWVFTRGTFPNSGYNFKGVNTDAEGNVYYTYDYGTQATYIGRITGGLQPAFAWERFQNSSDQDVTNIGIDTNGDAYISWGFNSNNDFGTAARLLASNGDKDVVWEYGNSPYINPAGAFYYDGKIWFGDVNDDSTYNRPTIWGVDETTTTMVQQYYFGGYGSSTTDTDNVLQIRVDADAGLAYIPMQQGGGFVADLDAQDVLYHYPVANNGIAGRNGNVYLLEYTTSYGRIHKVTDSGATSVGYVQVNSGRQYLTAIDTDADGNVYVWGDTSVGNSTKELLKFDADLNLEWTREFHYTGYTGAGNVVPMTIGVNGEILMGLDYYNATLGETQLLMKYPADGSITGTFDINGVDLVISAGSSTASTLNSTTTTVNSCSQYDRSMGGSTTPTGSYGTSAAGTLEIIA